MQDINTPSGSDFFEKNYAKPAMRKILIMCGAGLFLRPGIISNWRTCMGRITLVNPSATIRWGAYF